ncbi:hypothetical protein NPIL_154451, partial [Nephila pilipes]
PACPTVCDNGLVDRQEVEARWCSRIDCNFHLRVGGHSSNPKLYS